MSLTATARKTVERLEELTRRRHFEPYTIEKTVGTRTFPLCIGDPEGEAWYADGGRADWPEMSFLERILVRSGDVVLECGGHHGVTAILLADMVGPDGHVVSFEPSSPNLAILQRNVELNHLTNVTVEHAAVGARPGEVQIFKRSNASVIPRRRLSKGMLNVIYGVERVPVVTIDDYVTAHGLSPSVLKIDVEGFEADVLAGAEQVLRAAPKIALEIHTEVLDRYGTSVAELLALVDLRRYDAWVQWDDRTDPLPFDGTQEITHRVHLFAVPRSR